METNRGFKQLHVLYVVSGLMDLGMSAVTFAIGRRAAELGATPLQLGLLGSVWLGIYTVCVPFTGRASDRVGRRTMAISGAVIAAATTFGCALTTNVSLLLVVTSILGIGVAAYWPPIISWFSEGLSGPTLATQMSRFSIAWNIGMFTGYGFSGVLFQRGPQLVFYLAAGCMVVTTLLLFLPTRAMTVSQPKHGADIAPVPKGRGFRKTAWLSNFSMLFAMSGTLALFPQLAIHLGLSPKLHGTLLVFHRVASFLVTLVWPYVRFWQTRLWPLWIAQTLCALGVTGIAFGVTPVHFGIALAVCGGMLGFNYQTSLFFTLEEMSEKGKGSGIHEAMLSAGAFLGPLLAGWVGSTFDHGNGAARTPYFFCATVLASFVVIEMAVVAWRRRTAQKTV